MDISDLKKIGLTEGEVKIYDALLELGETTRTQLAKKSGVSPSKIYDVTNRLLEKGVISSVKKRGVLHFSAADPQRLREFIEHKEEELDEQRELVDKLLPTLLLKYKKTEEQVDVEVFYGWEGMKTVYNDVVKSLSKGDKNYIFGASMGQNPKQADIFFDQYNKKMEKKKYSTLIIFNENMRKYPERTEYFVKNKRHKVKYLYQDTFTEMHFYKDTVLFIMLLKKPIVVRIKNKEAADSFMKFFRLMWNLAKK